MRKEIDVSNLFMLKDSFGCINNTDRDNIKEFFIKKNYRSSAHEYKMGSPQRYEEMLKDKEIEALPNHKIRITESSVNINLDYQNIVKYTICYLTSTSINYDDYYDTEEIVESELMFLIENSHRGYGLILNFRELFDSYEIQDALMVSQEEDRVTFYHNWFNDVRKELTSYSLLIPRIIKGEKELKEVSVYSEKISIGDDSWDKDYLDIVAKAMKDESYEFFDSDNKLIKYEHYRYEDFLEFWEKYNTGKQDLTI